MVNLFLDIPGDMYCRLNKNNLKKKEVKLQGAGWDSASFYCSNNNCGYLILSHHKGSTVTT